jgi:CDP-diacylglycerol---serine O-phosphatidyltransferase
MAVDKPERPRGRGIYLLPNLFTLSALFAGFFAIVMGMERHFDNAAIAIFIAMILDALDGRVARLTNTQTLFGAELDSLSDMVSFGVAPAVVVYAWALRPLGKIGWIVALIYTIAGALRLARFNVAGGSADKRYFKGLPIPSAAAVVASMVWNGHIYQLSGYAVSVVAGIVTLIIGLLMVSNLRYRSFKDLDLKGKVPFFAILVVVLVLVLIAVDPPQVLLVVFLGYAIAAPLVWLSKVRRMSAIQRLARRRRHHQQ